MLYRRENAGYLVRLKKGEDVLGGLLALVEKEKIQGGFFFGLGAVRKVTLGFYDIIKQEYTKKEFEGDFEAANLTGNISYVEGKPFIHCHATIAKEDLQAVAGHLFGGEVAVTLEVMVMPTQLLLERKFDTEVKLNLLDIK